MSFRNITIVYITSREKPCIEWFLDSLGQQSSSLDGVQVIIVDSHAEPKEGLNRFSHLPDKYKAFQRIRITAPKPTVWQGPHRLTKENWWAASNARNTGICLCETEWIAFCDDRCVLMPTWLQSVREAMAGNYAVFGAYQKRHGITVENGIIMHSGIVTGEDSREEYVNKFWAGAAPVKCPGEWSFGCTLAFPLEWALQVNGYDENCDGVSMEDVIFGSMLQNNGYDLRYDYRMKIIEDRTPEHLGTPMIRRDKGATPNDKSHALQNGLIHNKHTSHPINLRKIRADVLAGKPFPPPWGPVSDWWDGQPVSEMK